MLVLVRHGRTTMNAEGRLLGRLDPPLDAVGEAQAAAAASSVAALLTGTGRPVRVVSSPLARTRATAEAIAAALAGGGGSGGGVEIDERWIELDYGAFDGVPLADVPVDTWRAWRSDVDFCPPSGESLAALGRRVRAACDEVASSGAAGAVDGDVVVVSHVSPIKAAVAWALGVGDEVTWRLYLAPGSITTVAVTERGPTLHGYNLVPDVGAG